ncbi:MAG: hypothetical protein BWY68_00051 [bacterium ADurb.Bin400]|nr:MAG: hypothetical protein BWY68_00051 [bacterium ADurb.Bin400]
MDKFRKLRDVARTVVLSGAVILTSGAGVSLASLDAESLNDTTGPYSHNENEIEIESDIEIDIENDAEVKNWIDLWLNTGKNDIERNTSVEDISTGDIEVEFDFQNEANVGSVAQGSGSVLGNLFFDDLDVFLGNRLTGPYSHNENEVKVENDVEIDIENDAEIDNDIDIDANTGKNDIERNTLVGDVETGDIEVELSIENEANTNQCFTCPDLLSFGGGLGDLDVEFSNYLTGPDSENENELKVENDVEIDVKNDAEIKNNIDVNANTGYNDVEKNTVVGDVSTGSISVDLSLYNRAN